MKVLIGIIFLALIIISGIIFIAKKSKSHHVYGGGNERNEGEKKPKERTE